MVQAVVLFQEQELSIRQLERGDVDLLVKWLSDPAVLMYYEGRDRPHNTEMVVESFFGDQGSGEARCIIQYESKDIGYIQFYPIDEEEIQKYGYESYHGQVYGMDQFIGETDYWNRGIGTRLVRATVEYLIAHKGATKIVMDPQVRNERALRVYEKAGFSKKKRLEKHEWHEGEMRDCWLIEYDA
ncbi:GNAT family N-acetyltransferase [Paenibacillus arenosi]|uniref:GNAT family N-acetyltransferase n=1 Tax=Paenibacillus arenosi TaxID=2774142 RepID=A0ABR9ASY8_9BACL|nr:GNAT family N-acetyltransferase [Paenibacillus arenosi]MBD8497233.1 GNAT family N-acetyltransferase [Paenibacillus arenosi]